MKYLIPVLVGGAAITATITTALAQARGALSGHASLTPYLYGYGASAILLVIAAVVAVNAHRQEKKKDAATPSPPVIPPVHQENKQSQIFNPTIVFGSHDRESDTKKEHDRQEKAVLEYMRRQFELRPSMTHMLGSIASGVGLDPAETDQALHRLFAKNLVFRGPIDAPGDFLWWYRDLV